VCLKWNKFIRDDDVLKSPKNANPFSTIVITPEFITAIKKEISLINILLKFHQGRNFSEKSCKEIKIIVGERMKRKNSQIEWGDDEDDESDDGSAERNDMNLPPHLSRELLNVKEFNKIIKFEKHVTPIFPLRYEIGEKRIDDSNNEIIMPLLGPASARYINSYTPPDAPRVGSLILDALADTVATLDVILRPFELPCSELLKFFMMFFFF
jgi:hypothetical protein